MDVAIITKEEYRHLIGEIKEVKQKTAFVNLIPTDVPDWATLEEINKITSISWPTMKTLVQAGVVGKTKILGSVKYNKHDFLEYIYQNQDRYHLKTA